MVLGNIFSCLEWQGKAKDMSGVFTLSYGQRESIYVRISATILCCDAFLHGSLLMKDTVVID